MAFILTWMSLDSAMALAIPSSVKHYLLGTWSASYVTCQELAFYSTIFVAGKQAYPDLRLSTCPHASILYLWHSCRLSLISRRAVCPADSPRAAGFGSRRNTRSW
jgi:hypothetical protein